MLIDTKQIITKTQLRNNLSKYIALNKQGKSFMISDRGDLTSVLLSIDLLDQQIRTDKKRLQLIKEGDQLARKLRKYTSSMTSTEFIRKMRDSRH